MKIYLPGDVIRCKITNGIGVVVTSQILVSGNTIEWNKLEFDRELTGISQKSHYFGTNIIFEYACENLPGEEIDRYAWYAPNELELIKRGAVYEIMYQKYSLNKLEQ